MNKVLLGLLLGAVLGAIDGATAWFTPAVRVQLAGIIVGSTVKGLIAGVAAGIFARKVNSVPLGILFGVRLLFRDHPARQHRRIDRGLRHAEVRSRSRSNRSDAVNLDFEFFLASKYF